MSPKDHSPLPGQGESSNDISEAKLVRHVIIFCSFEVYSMSEIDISFWIPVFSDLIILAGINRCLPPRQDTNVKMGWQYLTIVIYTNNVSAELVKLERTESML